MSDKERQEAKPNLKGVISGVRLLVLLGLRKPTSLELTRQPVRFWQYGYVRLVVTVVTTSVLFLAAAKYLFGW